MTRFYQVERGQIEWKAAGKCLVRIDHQTRLVDTHAETIEATINELMGRTDWIAETDGRHLRIVTDELA